ncbi:unnamed protein product, partial [Effrenium voratum]
ADGGEKCLKLCEQKGSCSLWSFKSQSNGHIVGGICHFFNSTATWQTEAGKDKHASTCEFQFRLSLTLASPTTGSSGWVEAASPAHKAVHQRDLHGELRSNAKKEYFCPDNAYGRTDMADMGNAWQGMARHVDVIAAAQDVELCPNHTEAEVEAAASSLAKKCLRAASAWNSSAAAPPSTGSSDPELWCGLLPCAQPEKWSETWPNVVQMVVFSVFGGTGTTIQLCWQGFVGTFCACLNCFVMSLLFPEGGKAGLASA